MGELQNPRAQNTSGHHNGLDPITGKPTGSKMATSPSLSVSRSHLH